MASLPPRLLHFLGQRSRARYAQDFERSVKDPVAAQEQYLQRLLRQNAGTQFGKQHGFDRLLERGRFAETVPLMQPLELQPWVLRQMKGEKNLLTAQAPIYYVMTSGSTAEPKYVPITPAYREDLQRTVHVSLHHLYRRLPLGFRGRALYFVGSRRVARAEDGCDIGTMSGFNFTEMPKVARALYAWPYELFEVKDLAVRNTLALLLATLGSPSLIAGVFPAPIVYLLRELAERAGELAGILASGVIPGFESLTPEQQSFFRGKLANPPSRVIRRLERAAKAPVEEKVAEAWPDLRLVYCWISSTAGLFVPELKRRLGPQVAVRDAIYSACESWMSVPLGDEEPGGVLAVESSYYEFIEEASFESGNPKLVPLESLKSGERYYIVFSNTAGLYRYVLGDVVEVYGFYGKAPRIRFVRKGGASSNLLGEKLDEAHVNGAMTTALSSQSLEATFFTLVPSGRQERPGYLLLVETTRPLSEPASVKLAQACDQGLRASGYDYDRLRKSGSLHAVEAVVLPAGTYQRVRERRVSQGSAEAQLKTAHLVSSASKLDPELQEVLAERERHPRT